jgi:hypothetical protein
MKRTQVLLEIRQMRFAISSSPNGLGFVNTSLVLISALPNPSGQCVPPAW